MKQNNLLVWLPSPMGDAVLCTPALRAIRKHFDYARITFLAADTVRQILSPCPFNDEWIVPTDNNPFTLAGELAKHSFTGAILFKNSFGSALAALLAGIENRIGYSRDGRGFLLTDKLRPPKLPDGKYRPLSMVDYYLAVASWLGADTADRRLELSVADESMITLKKKLPSIFDSERPIVILVPGGAFGLSKCWPADRFAKTADWLIENHNAVVIISVAPQKNERQTARQISDASRHSLINLAENPLMLGELKALFSKADLVICNDTGPRHIAIAFDRKVITMFGPNDPVWTQTGNEKEIQIIGRAPCVPCQKPACSKSEHLCMNSITVQRICTAADRLLKEENFKELSDTKQQFVWHGDFFVDENYQQDFRSLGLTSIDSVFSFDRGENLRKKNLAGYRTRIKFQIGPQSKICFLKRYQNPPFNIQLDRWLCNHGPTACGFFEVKAAKILTAAGVNTAKIVAYGQQTNLLFEHRSFIITEQVPRARSLEQKLPDYFDGPSTGQNLSRRRRFIDKLAKFIKTIHETGFCHRDLYLCHILFCNDKERFTLIDLARAFQPWLLGQRFRIKDIAQLHYSAPAKYFSRTDRLRFYKAYGGRNKLAASDKNFIKQVINKVHTMARHNRKHGRPVPFTDIK